jgi:uncharacterized membrane protein
MVLHEKKRQFKADAGSGITYLTYLTCRSTGDKNILRQIYEHRWSTYRQLDRYEDILPSTAEHIVVHLECDQLCQKRVIGSFNCQCQRGVRSVFVVRYLIFNNPNISKIDIVQNGIVNRLDRRHSD